MVDQEDNINLVEIVFGDNNHEKIMVLFGTNCSGSSIVFLFQV